MMCTGAIILIGFGDLVDLRLLRFACMCPIGLAGREGGYLQSCFLVKDGNDVSHHAAMARTNVESGGEKRLAVYNFIRSAIVGASITKLRE